jgi:hypothetical protein
VNSRVAIEPDTSPKNVDLPTLKVLAVSLNVVMEAVTSLTENHRSRKFSLSI